MARLKDRYQNEVAGQLFKQVRLQERHADPQA